MNKVLYKIIIFAITILAIVTVLSSGKHAFVFASRKLFEYGLLDYNMIYTYAYYPENITEKDYVKYINSFEYDGITYYPKSVTFYDDWTYMEDDEIYFMNRYHHNKEVIYCSNHFINKIINDLKDGKEVFIKVHGDQEYLYKMVIYFDYHNEEFIGDSQFTSQDYIDINLEYLNFEDVNAEGYEKSVIEFTSYYDLNGADYENVFGLLVK